MLAVFILDSDAEGYPPAFAVPWRVWTVTGKFHEETISARSWFAARQEAAKLFGCPFEWVEATRDLEREDEEHAAERKRADSTMGRVA